MGVSYTALSAMPPSEVRLIQPTPDDRSASLLKQRWSTGSNLHVHRESQDFKIERISKISLEKFKYFLHHIHRYMTKHHSMLLHQSKSSEHSYVFVVRHILNAASNLYYPFQDTNGQSFEDDHDSYRWNTGIFQRWSGMSVGPSTLRSSFIT